METNDGKVFSVDLESTECAVGLIAILLDDGTTGFTVFRGKREAICQYVEQEAVRDDVVFATVYGEEVNDVYSSDSAVVMARLGKLMHDAVETHGDGVNDAIDDLLKASKIIRN